MRLRKRSCSRVTGNTNQSRVAVASLGTVEIIFTDEGRGSAVECRIADSRKGSCFLLSIDN